MLITLYLIVINSYNSIDAPPGRGFSSIEVKDTKQRQNKSKSSTFFLLKNQTQIFAFDKKFKLNDIHSRLERIIKKSSHPGKRQLGRDRGPLWGSENP